jgi:hypothetical protein
MVPGVIALFLFSMRAELTNAIGAVFMLPVIFSVYRLATGPVWYRGRGWGRR